jgi:sugar lactone lactonase YvrE
VPPTSKPAYRWFVVDDQGYLWVSMYAPDPDDGQHLEVFDPAGRLLGRVRLAFRFDPAVLPVVKGTSFLAHGRDELDAQYVIRGRIAGRQ